MNPYAILLVISIPVALALRYWVPMTYALSAALAVILVCWFVFLVLQARRWQFRFSRSEPAPPEDGT